MSSSQGGTARRVLTFFGRHPRLPQEREPTFTGSCPIREHTWDGHYVGRCEFATYDGYCPRHGALGDYSNNDDREVAPQDRRHP